MCVELSLKHVVLFLLSRGNLFLLLGVALRLGFFGFAISERCLQTFHTGLGLS